MNVPQSPVHRHKHYVQFDIGGEVQATGKSEKVTDPVWAETLSLCVSPVSCVVKNLLSSSNTSPSSIFICRLYQSSGQVGRRFGHHDKVIGVTKESFDLLHGEGSLKGLFSICRPLSCIF